MLDYQDFSLRVHTRAGNSGHLTNAQIELTYGCNLHCVHCYTDCYNRPDLLKREMPYDQVIRTLDQLHEAGVLWICFTGGEIFLRRDFFTIYDYARSKGFLITLFTNGTLVTDSIADRLQANPPFCIEVSCHGATAETFDRVTQVRGSFVKFLHGVRLLVERGLPVKIKTKAMTLNQHELGQIQQLVESLGLRFQINATIYPRLDGDLTPTHYRLTPEEIVTLEWSGGEEEDRDTNCGSAATALLGPPADDRLFRCGCGTTQIHINAWGQAGACTWSGVERVDLATRSLPEAVTAVFEAVRQANYVQDTPCRSCHVYRFCDKMPANAEAENGDREHPVAHFCQTAFKRAEQVPGASGALDQASHTLPLNKEVEQ